MTAAKCYVSMTTGSIPQDNPFIGKPGYKPEIYTMGHRNMTGMGRQSVHWRDLGSREWSAG